MTSRDQEFDDFFLSHYDAIVRTLTAITGDHDRATDAAQEAFIKAYAKWPTVRKYDMPWAWVRRVAINASRDSHRSERRRLRRERRQDASAVPSPADDVIGTDSARAMLDGLPRRLREVATLFYVDDQSVHMIATILNVSEGTVKSHLSDARRHMREHLETERADR